MGTIQTLDGGLVETLENVLPFLDETDGIALSESVLARKPVPQVASPTSASSASSVLTDSGEPLTRIAMLGTVRGCYFNPFPVVPRL